MAEKLRLDIPILLPGIPDTDDACVSRLICELKTREGVEQVHIAPADHDNPARLCIHYDNDALSLSRIRELVGSVGAKITEQFGHILWHVDGISHERRARTVAERLRTMPGVLEAEASVTGKVRAEFERSRASEAEIRDVLAKMGVSPTDDVSKPASSKDIQADKPRNKESHRQPSKAQDYHSVSRHGGEHDHEGRDQHDHDHDHAHGGLLGQTPN